MKKDKVSLSKHSSISLRGLQDGTESVVSYHSNTTGPLIAIHSFDRSSQVSGVDKRSLAPSLLKNDFNGKKSKIIQTLRQIDEIGSGVVKSIVFTNLLACLDVEMNQADFAECQKKLGVVYQNMPYIKYETVLRQMHYDNHSEKWVIKMQNDDGDTLSVIAEKGRSLRQSFQPRNLARMSLDSERANPSLKRDSLRKALRGQVLSTDALMSFAQKEKTTKIEDQEAVDIFSKHNRPTSLRKQADQIGKQLSQVNMMKTKTAQTSSIIPQKQGRNITLEEENINNYRQRLTEIAKNKTPSMADLKAKNEKKNQIMRAQRLRQLLTVNSEEEKLIINKITSCIKFMHQNYDIESFRLGKLYQEILKEFKGKSEPTHVPEDIFIRIASAALKLPQLPSTRLYDKLKVCIIDEKYSSDEGTPTMFSLKNFKLFVDLYQFLPSKKGTSGGEFKNLISGATAHTRSGRNQFGEGHGMFNTISTPLDDLQKGAITLQQNLIRNQKSRQSSKLQSSNPEMNEEQRSKLKLNLNSFSKCLIEKFGKVSTAFRAFDVRTRGAVSFSDFACVIDQLKLGFDRDVILQIFTYMDYDYDSLLKYRDFCNICAEHVLNGAPSLGETSIMNSSSSYQNKTKASSDFSQIIKQMKAKRLDSRGRGGPNFYLKRGSSAGQNIENAKSIKQLTDEQPFVSTELHRFMVKKQDLPLGHGFHSPLHNRFDGIRDDSVYNSIGGGQPQSEWSRSAASSSLNKLRSKLQKQIHGSTSEHLSYVSDPRSKAYSGQMAACINYDYERDYIIESMMQDKIIQAKKARQKSFDMRKTTKAQEGQIIATKKRIQRIEEKEADQRGQK